MPNKFSLAIAYPHPGEIKHCFMDSLMRFREFDLANGQILGARIPEQGMYIAGMRNRMVKKFLEQSTCEWLMMIDSDHQFTPEQPYLMLKSAEENDWLVGSALYFGILNGIYSPMWWKLTPDGNWATVSTIVPGLQEIDGFGCGMCLMHRSVLEQMAPHYPDDPWKWFGHDLTERRGEMERFGEDLCFCNRVRGLGIKIYGDSRITIGHEKTINLDLEMFVRMSKYQEEGMEPGATRVLDAVI